MAWSGQTVAAVAGRGLNEWLGVACSRAAGLLLGCMAGDTDLIALRISEVRAVVVGVVLRSQTRRSFVFAAECERRSVSRIDLAPVCGKERNHLAIAWLMRILVVWRADEEEWPWLW